MFWCALSALKGGTWWLPSVPSTVAPGGCPQRPQRWHLVARELVGPFRGTYPVKVRTLTAIRYRLQLTNTINNSFLNKLRLFKVRKNLTKNTIFYTAIIKIYYKLFFN